MEFQELLDTSNYADLGRVTITITFTQKDTFHNTHILVLVEQVTMEPEQVTILFIQNIPMVQLRRQVTMVIIVIILRLGRPKVSDFQMTLKTWLIEITSQVRNKDV
jgi:hypothetical protein